MRLSYRIGPFGLIVVVFLAILIGYAIALIFVGVALLYCFWYLFQYVCWEIHRVRSRPVYIPRHYLRRLDDSSTEDFAVDSDSDPTQDLVPVERSHS